MARGSLVGAAAAAVLALAACSERQPEGTTGPQFVQGTDPCAFSNSLVTNYFPSSRQATALSLKQSMGNAGHGTTGARNAGFELMDSIGSVSRKFTISGSAGAQLTVAVIGCMFDEAANFEYPTTALNDFTLALTSVSGGAFYVRGGGREGTILGRANPPGGVSGNLSGIEPSSGAWTGVLPAGIAEGRALFYGYPASQGYEWATVPSNLPFTNPLTVAVCDSDNPTLTGMLNETAVGVLAYVNSGICSTITQPSAMIESGWGPKALFARIGRMFVGSMTPTPLQATAVATSTGGKTSTIPKSIFGKKSVSTLKVDWLDAAHTPPNPINGTSGTSSTSNFAVAVTVSASVDGSPTPVFGTCVYLSGSNNNGTPTQLTTTKSPAQNPACTNPPGGDLSALSVLTEAYSTTATKADFGVVGVTKTGGISIKATADVIDRDGLGFIAIKSNVKPAK